jgi:phospholipid/cholesterol/gamma-HCH transport system substrate-binding protein
MPRTRSLAWAELKIGILAILAIVITTFLIFMVGNTGGFFWQVYPLKTTFTDVQGLKEGALVRVAGVEVGTVSAVRFAESGAGVEVEVELAKEMQPRITTDSRAEIGSLSLLGEAVVDISAATTGRPLAPGESIQSRPAAGQIKAVAESASSTLEQVNSLLADVRAGKGTVGRLFTEDDLHREIQGFMAASAAVARELNRGRGTAGRLIRDPSLYQALDASMANLQTMLQRINAGEGSLGRLLKDDAFAESLTGATASFRTLSERLNKGEGTAGKLLTDSALYDRLNSVTTRLDDLTGRLNAGEGTMGQLLRDRQLYENMNRTVTELRDLIGDIRKDPKKYLNVRVSIF